MSQARFSAAEIRAAGGLDKWAAAAAKPAQAAQKPPVPAPSVAARGRVPADPLLGFEAERMNELEARYARHLELLRRAGKIALWRFEAVKLRLADRTWYTPDFFVLRADGRAELHETKGFWQDDARVKIKTTAENFREFGFVAVQWDSKANCWKFEGFRRGNGTTDR